jgi:hypothetical protein
LDFFPVDRLAEVTVGAVATPATVGRVRTVAAGNLAPTVAHSFTTTVAALNEWRAAHGHTSIQTPRIVPPDRWNASSALPPFRPFARAHMTERQNTVLDKWSFYEPYLTLTLTGPLPATHEAGDADEPLRTAWRIGPSRTHDWRRLRRPRGAWISGRHSPAAACTAGQGCPPKWTRRQLIHGIRFRIGVPWRDVPGRVRTLAHHLRTFRCWQRDGTWRRS